MTRPTADARREVIRRAGNRCEYCLIHQMMPPRDIKSTT
jgi:hypothetical protein